MAPDRSDTGFRIVIEIARGSFFTPRFEVEHTSALEVLAPGQKHISEQYVLL